MPDYSVATWQKLSDCLSKQVSKETFNTWFKHLKLIDWSNQCVRLATPNRYVKQWVESHYYDEVLAAARELNPNTQSFELVSAASKSNRNLDAVPSIGATITKEIFDKTQPATRRNESASRNLRSTYSYRLDTFVVGHCNRLAFTACQTIAEAPAQTYNPLIFVSEHGLGKTHLLQGLAHLLHIKYPSQRIRLVSCEQFANDYIAAIRDRKTDVFRGEYRKNHILLVDDIQFLGGKEKTQAEFLHTFDVLRNMGRQIILTSSVHPREIKKLDECLSARLQAGLIARLTPPCFETRIKILKAKSRKLGFALKTSVAEILAHRVEKNVRELEGAICKLNALSATEGRPPEKDMALLALHELGYLREGPLSLEEILDTVVKGQELNADAVRSARRERSVVRLRHMAMYISKTLTTKSLGEIGRYYGNRDHATVLHAYRKIERLAKQDTTLADELKALQLKLGR